MNNISFKLSLKKPKYIIDAHLGKVMRSTFCRFDENLIASVSNDLSFALWDVSNRDKYGVPDLKRRVEIPNKVRKIKFLILNICLA